MKKLARTAALDLLEAGGKKIRLHRGKLVAR